MVNNEAYSAIESIAIHLYDTGKLDLATLDVICGEWQWCDVDPGGSNGLKTKDGLCLDEVIVKVANPAWWKKNARKRPKAGDNTDKWGTWYYAYSNECDKITRKRWKWC